MGKDEFVKLLITQMQNQDPMNPMDGKDLAAQLAQFSSVEQLININAKLDGFAALLKPAATPTAPAGTTTTQGA
jgi:flagellar basal-body rod modification protein FlgD